MNKLGQTIAAVRRDRGLSQKQLASLVGIHKNQVQTIEVGKTPSPGIVIVAKLCKALGLDGNVAIEAALAVPDTQEELFDEEAS